MKSKAARIRKEEALIDEWFNATDLSENIKNGVVVKGRTGRPAVGSKISVTLPDDLIADLKKAAE